MMPSQKTLTVISNQSPVYDDLTFDNVAEIAEMLMEQFESKAVDKIEIIYNKFKNAATQEIMTEQFLPIEPLEGDTNANLDYIFEPSKEEIVETLNSKVVKDTIVQVHT